MKTLIIIFILCFSAAACLYSQEQIPIAENGHTEICGRNVIVAGIWVNEGIIRADIAIMENPNSKPITGGYKKGDEITISSKEGCTYFIFSITKSGLSNSKGKVVLSKDPPLMAVEKCDDFVTFYEGRSYAIDTMDWNFIFVDESEGMFNANINVYYNTNLISNLSIKKGDILWLGECVYKTETIKLRSVDKSNYETIPAEVTFKKIESHFYSDSSDMRGELNKPKTKSEYIIRKAKIYKKKRPTEDELKNTKSELWLIEIFYKSRGHASMVMQVERGGVKIMVEVDPIKTFRDETEALEYAKENGITDIKLEEE